MGTIKAGLCAIASFNASMKATLTVVAALSAANVVHAQSVTLTKYLDTDDNVQIPGAPAGTFFTSFERESPSIENGVLCFEAGWYDPILDTNIDGIYTISESGVVTLIVNELEFDPNGNGSAIELPLISDGIVSFEGTSSNSLGIWSRAADGTGPLNALASLGDTLPIAGAPTITDFSQHGRDGDWIIIETVDSVGNLGVYTRNIMTNTYALYANEGDPSPFPGGAGATFDAVFNEATTHDGRFSVRAGDTNGTFGLLTDFNDGNGIVTPVYEGASLPSPHGAIDQSFDESSIKGSKVVWQGSTINSNNFSIILYDNATGEFTVIANDFVSRPDGNTGGVFDGFNGNPSLNITDDGTTIVVWETGDFSNDDIWAWVDGVYLPIVREGDVIDGKTVSGTSHRFPYSIDGTSIGVRVTFTDGSQALYRADIVLPTEEEFVTYTFAGEVTVVDSYDGADLSDDFTVGQAVTGSFTVSTAVPDSDASSNAGQFDGAIVDFEMDIGGYLVTDTGASRIEAIDNVTPVPFPQGDYVSSPLLQTSAGPIDGVNFSGINMLLGDFTNTAFDTQNPNSLSPSWDLNLFPDLGFFLEWVRFERRRGGSAVGGEIEVGNLNFQIVQTPDALAFMTDLGPAGPIGSTDPFEFDLIDIGPFSIPEATLGSVSLSFEPGQGVRFLDNAFEDNGDTLYSPSPINVVVEGAGLTDDNMNFISDVTLNLYNSEGQLIGTDSIQDEVVALASSILEFYPFNTMPPSTEPGPAFDVYMMEVIFENDLLGPVLPEATIVFQPYGTIEILGPCLADFTGEGELDFFDVSAFLTAFGLEDPIADFTGEGEFDFFDVSAFLAAFGAGCP
jgi:hypothetical protein